MTDPVLIHNARLVDHGRITEDGWLLLAEGRILRRGSGADRPAATVRHDAAGSYVSAGFVDIHCHGGGGYSSEEGVDHVHGLAAFHRGHGTTSVVVSLATAPFDELLAQLDTIRSAALADPRILGAHLEGPFLDAGHRGAHDERLLLVPTPASVGELLRVAEGCLRQITLAPEHASPEVLDLLLDAGVRVAVGHTSATTEVATVAFRRGASLLTHAFNGMPGIHHRDPGPIAAALDSGATLELIADGVHVDPAVIRMLFQLAPGRVALITDAMAAAGADDGEYRLGEHTVLVRNGIARLGEDGSLAGSTLTLDRAVQFAHRSGVPVPTALQAATATPAREIGAAEVGDLSIGSFADVVQLDAELTVTAVWSRGNRL